MSGLAYHILKDVCGIFRRIAQSTLSKEECNILTATNDLGDIYLLKQAVLGQWIRAGEIDFFKSEDLAYSAKYQDALDSLVKRGLVRHTSGDAFRLTGRGFDRAKQLKRKKEQKGS